jgi:hypothetical protein
MNTVDNNSYNAIHGENTMSNFASLKKSSGDLDRLSREIEKVNAPASSEKKGDDRFWKLDRDKSGNGSAIIRFLPSSAVDGEDALPWVRIFSHGFKGPTGKWYIENSLTTLNQKDPVSEFNSQLWNATTDEQSWQRKQAKEQKRRLNYISNIYVVSDPKNPENEGKVFLFKFGKKIFDKITMLMNPEFVGDTPVNPFDLWKGANFKIRIRTVDGYPNYDQSVFDASKPLKEDDAELEAIWNRQYSLKEFIDPKNFKSYDELKRKLHDVLGESHLIPTEKQSVKSSVVEKPVFNKPKTVEDSDVTFSVDDDDDELDAFKKLALG